MWKISYYIWGDLIKSRVILAYTFFLVLAGWGVFILEGQPEKALLVLMQIILLAVPLVTMVFTTVYYYNSHEFIIFLLAQPLRRITLIRSFFYGVGFAFLLSFLAGMGLPALIFYPSSESLFLVLAGGFLSLIGTATALFISTLMSEKTRGMGMSLLLWAFFAFIYDGLLLFLMYQLADYPIEKGILVLSFFNPIDIARITIIMKTEASALLGLSGAVFQDFFGSIAGTLISFSVLFSWIAVPFYFARRRFIKKDL